MTGLGQLIRSRLSPKAKKYIGWIGLATIVLIFSILISNSRSRRIEKTPKTIEKIDMLDYNDTAFEESMEVMLNNTETNINSLREEINGLRRSLANIDTLDRKIDKVKESLEEEQKSALSHDSPLTFTSVSDPVPQKKKNPSPTKSNTEDLMLSSIDTTQSDAYARLKALAEGVAFPGKDDLDVEEISPPAPLTTEEPAESNGGIEIYRVEQPQSKEDEYDIKIIPSGTWMDASLLTGVIASTGNNQPVPMLIRINDLAVLPNEIKEDLKGCFVVGNGTAALDQERIKGHTVSLSCVAQNGTMIIDEKIKGWIADQDSAPGLAAKPIARFGAALARVALSGFIGGLGSAINESSLSVNRDITGGERVQFKDTELDTIFKSGLGRSIEGVANNLESFYMDLAKNTLPVLQVGPTKHISVVLLEQVKLRIKARKENEIEDET